MDYTTNINDLPLNPSSNDNITFVVNEKASSTNTIMNTQNPVSLDQTTINQIVSGLQQASATGVTQLPSRDIPRLTENIVRDVQIQPNYIPETKHTDYINNENNKPEKIMNDYISTEMAEKQFETMYDKFQTPVLLSVLYFIFQLPILRKMLFNYVPILFSKDGNININGLAFMSIMYGVCYYLVTTIMVQLNHL